MNANELAELIEHLENAKYVGASKAATMLRQQAEQINNLQQWEKRQLDVIEAQKEKLTKYELRHAEQRKRIEELEAKTLTDEEILEVWGDQIITETEKDAAIPFARAILRKAQEK